MNDQLVQVIFLVTDLAVARRRMESFGLAVLDGGRHRGRGTANLIVPLGTQYVELLAIIDREEALASPAGRPVVAAMAARGPGLARWSVEAGDIAATGRRLGAPVEQRERVLPDGHTIRWQAVGVDPAWAEPWRCAFMSWPVLQDHPGRAAALHPCGATGFARLDVVIPDRLAATSWLGGQVPPGVNLTDTADGVDGVDDGPRQVVLQTPSGELNLD